MSQPEVMLMSVAQIKDFFKLDLSGIGNTTIHVLLIICMPSFIPMLNYLCSKPQS